MLYVEHAQELRGVKELRGVEALSLILADQKTQSAGGSGLLKMRYFLLFPQICSLCSSVGEGWY